MKKTIKAKINLDQSLVGLSLSQRIMIKECILDIVVENRKEILETIRETIRERLYTLSATNGKLYYNEVMKIVSEEILNDSSEK